jgi:cytoskeletal protein RodZ
MTAEVASVLKQARQEKGLSLEDVEISTRIPIYYLELLEGQGDPRVVGESAYLIPFLRGYSDFLGLDPAVMVAHFVNAIQSGNVLSEVPRRKIGGTGAFIALLLLAGLGVVLFLWLTGGYGSIPWQ